MVNSGIVRLVAICLNFSRMEDIPSMVRGIQKTARGGRNHSPTGVAIPPPTGEKCFLTELFWNLEDADYELVDAFYKRVDTAAKTYHMVRYVFVLSEFADLSEAFVAKRGALHQEALLELGQTIWSIRKIDQNPFYLAGKAVPGQSALDINFNGRESIVDDHGRPKMFWPKDQSGRRIGDIKVPLMTKVGLGFENGAVTVLTV